MREIKFRFKRRDTWYYIDFSNIQAFAKELLEALSSEDYVFEIDTPMLEYTGLKDKSGKEIYEGDIVQYNHSTAEYGFPLKYKGAVEWFDGYPPEGNNAKFHINNRVDYGQDIIWHEIEVIGNIYENSGLLKGEECERLER